MEVYIEELEELNTPGVTNYSLVRGMDFYDADVRASGVTITRRDESEMDEGEVYELYDAIKKFLVKEIGEERW